MGSDARSIKKQGRQYLRKQVMIVTATSVFSSAGADLSQQLQILISHSMSLLELFSGLLGTRNTVKSEPTKRADKDIESEFINLRLDSRRVQPVHISSFSLYQTYNTVAHQLSPRFTGGWSCAPKDVMLLVFAQLDVTSALKARCTWYLLNISLPGIYYFSYFIIFLKKNIFISRQWDNIFSICPLTLRGTPKLPLTPKQLQRLLAIFPKTKSVDVQFVIRESFTVLAPHQVDPICDQCRATYLSLFRIVFLLYQTIHRRMLQNA